MGVRFDGILTVGAVKEALADVPDDYTVEVWDGYNAATYTSSAEVYVSPSGTVTIE